jgi:hypothetical protein
MGLATFAVVRVWRTAGEPLVLATVYETPARCSKAGPVLIAASGEYLVSGGCSG